MAAQPALGRGLDRQALAAVAARAAERAARHDDRRPVVGVSLGRRPLREPRHLRTGPPPLPVHHRQRRRPGRPRHLRGSRQRHREVPRRLRRRHRNRSAPISAAAPAASANGTVRSAPSATTARIPTKRQGTLLYIKSSLTGDEPADVLRYASLHPAFPHESTSDQFFDESQFESYRALGYHIGCNVLSAAAERDEMATKTVVELFTDLRQQWTLSAPAPQDAVRKYSSALSDIWTTVRTTPELAFLDAQIFPEWVSFLTTGAAQHRATATSPPAPPAAAARARCQLLAARVSGGTARRILCLQPDAAIDGGRLPRIHARPALRPHRQPRLDEPVSALGVVGNAGGDICRHRLDLGSALPAVLQTPPRSQPRIHLCRVEVRARPATALGLDRLVRDRTASL